MDGNLTFERLNAFDMTVRYVEDAMGEPDQLVGHHIHAACEIYVHLSGDVSFMVEDQLYPIQYGNVVITRPYEYHHCMYHTKTRHRHFWILLSGEHNEKLLKLFFGRQKGRGNLLALENEPMQELVALCHTLCETFQGEVDKYFCFFKLLRLLENARAIGGDGVRAQSDVAAVLQAIHQNYAAKLSVRELAADSHISVSTLERWFAENLHMTPSVYIQKIRLANAARMLAEQATVTEAAERCGFSDVSAMIVQFKKQYGMTPLQYKKRANQQASIFSNTGKGETICQ